MKKIIAGLRQTGNIDLTKELEMVIAGLADNYLSFALPANNRTLSYLYDEYNKILFSGSLPKCRIKFVALAKNFHGKAHAKVKANKYADYLITMAKFNINNSKKLIDTLVHEMIHIWQYNMVNKTGDTSYTDESFSAMLLERDKHKRGHGKHFKQMMDKLNSKGFDITITSGDTPDINLDKEYYGIIFKTHDPNVIIYVYSAFNVVDKMDTIIEEIEKRAGSNFFTSFIIFKSKDSRLIQGTRLTKGGKLPKNVFNIFYNQKVYKIVESPLSKIIEEGEAVESPVDPENKVNMADIPATVIQMLQRMHKYRGKAGLNQYLSTFVMNHPDYKHLAKIPGLRFTMETSHPDFPDHIKEYIKQDWMDISVAEIKRGNLFKSILHDVHYSIVLNREISPNTISNWEYAYRDIEERVDKDKINKLLVPFLVNGIKKKNKKSGKTQDDKSIKIDVINLLSGTPFG